MGRKKELPVLEKITITDIGAEGNAIARVNNQVVFVPMLIPGDVADLRVIRKKKKYLECIPVKFHQVSPDRIEPACSHFGTCGGCKWQHLPYAKQLHHKEKQVADNLSRISGVELPPVKPVLGSEKEYFYRNKLEYTFSDRRWLTREEIASGKRIEAEGTLGFHIPGLFDKVLEIDKCYLQPEPTNRIRNAVRDYTIQNKISYYNLRDQRGLLRNLVIRNASGGQVMVIMVFAYQESDIISDLLGFIRREFPEVTSIMYIINPKKNDSVADLDVRFYSGSDHLVEEMDGLKFRIGPKSFYQTNTGQAVRMYRIVKEFAELTGNEIVYDLYTGTGTIACYLASSALKVVGIEYVDEAVRDAVINAELNGITNISFFAGDIRQKLDNSFIDSNGRPDVVITDPPRVGMHKDVTSAILSASPSRIVYVSCNPATQARDLSLLAADYFVAAVQPVDMFPHTAHVENILLLRRR
jgi:23S rRNA (uracil1939-C5)-methyltransferase